MVKLEGIFAPLITPFDETGEVDEGSLRALIDYLVGEGVHVLFPLGSVGMGPALTPDQRRRVIEIIVDHTAGRLPIVAHVGTADTQTSVALARHAAELGVAGLALIPPYYYRHTEYEVIEHYRAVGEAVSIPILLYNNPAFSGIHITAKLALRLYEDVPNIAGVKLTEDRMRILVDYLQTLPSSFTVLAGFNYYLAPTVPLGVRGSVDPLSTFFPKLYLGLWDALQRGDYARAFDLQVKANEAETAILTMSATVGRTVYQEALRLRRLPIKMYPRWRAQPLTPEQIETLRAIFDRVDRLTAASI